ncbi:MAG: RtcB family protein [Intestinibacter sp.]|uniref:RtcB family protein n=1 Tax=Intestinibacter sp. TaxID=1965304 RepID=UPI002A7545E7|nr:RtcB family protein [Intestinibacter sp.]MDY2735233.1 RtcB family protein [Intestinibacter sp.]MDY4576194.1 RtcB family protein [Intestinibacter sp.]
MLIKGNFNEAEVFTANIDDETIAQVKQLLDQEFVEDLNIRIMPDCHKGSGCVIGTTMTIKDKIVPNLVGVDIGCGVLCVELGNLDLDLKKIDDFIKNNIPHGFKINNKPVIDYLDEILKIKCLDDIPKNPTEFNRALGSLGGGNHFIEIDKDDSDNKYLVIHSGSRNLGLQVANHYQSVGYNTLNYISDEYEKKSKELIDEYKKAGKSKKIEKALKNLKKSLRVESKIPKDLCYIEGDNLKDYLHDMDIVQKYATKNRELMARRIVEFIGLDYDKLNKFESIHNYIEIDKSILRKGAISAYEGEDLLIPINMRDGVILGKGKGNPNWNYSAPHGAGRILSRAGAKDKIHMNDYKASMKGIFTTCVNVSTLDEAPQAYKPIEDILNNITDTVDIVKIIKPIYNFKSN